MRHGLGFTLIHHDGAYTDPRRQPGRPEPGAFPLEQYPVMKRTLMPWVGAVLALCGAHLDAAAADKTSLVVYTALEPDQLKTYKEAFEKNHPDIVIRFVRDATGVVTSKLIAEKAAPQADVVMGLAASSLVLLKQEKMLLEYEPKGFKELNPKYSDSKRPPSWVGMDVWGAAICFNTAEAQKRGLPRPESWKDLAKPVYKGQIVMPNPVSSGTGLFDVTAWLQLYGEAEAWKFMDGLHENIAHYTSSGSKPCRQAAAGEVAIGISFDYRAMQLKASGSPIDMVFPKDGIGWDIEATAIVKGTKNLEAAKKLADWSASREANELYQKNFAIVLHNDVNKPNAAMPAHFDQLLIKNDFDWVAKNREHVLGEWSKRYSAKNEAK